MRPGSAVRWLGQGVPSLYRTARAAGLGRRDALRVLEVSGRVLVLARRRYPRRWRAENAVRHFTWQAWLTAAYGRGVAAAIGAAHERMATDRVDSSVDRENNLLGQQYGEEHAQRIRADAVRPALSALADEAGRRFDEGLLRSQARSPQSRAT